MTPWTSIQALLLAVTLAVAGCAAPATTSGDPAAVFAHIKSRNAQTARVVLSDRLAGWLPNRVYETRFGTKQLSTRVVIGSVSSVVPGRAYSANEEGDKTWILDDFNSSQAMWRTVDVTMRADRSWPASSDEVRFGLALSGNQDVTKFIEGLLAMRSAIVFVYPSEQYEYDPSLHSVALGGELLGEVRSNGEIRFPALEFEETFVGNINTLDELDREMSKPVSTVTPRP